MKKLKLVCSQRYPTLILAVLDSCASLFELPGIWLKNKTKQNTIYFSNSLYITHKDAHVQRKYIIQHNI
jgi:hypothetical protein